MTKPPAGPAAPGGRSPSFASEDNTSASRVQTRRGVQPFIPALTRGGPLPIVRPPTVLLCASWGCGPVWRRPVRYAIVRGRSHVPSRFGPPSAGSPRGALGDSGGGAARPGPLHRPARSSRPASSPARRARCQSNGLKTVGDVTTVGNAEPVPLGGVGLVVGLEGTGGEPATDNFRTICSRRTSPRRASRTSRAKLADPNHALVVVTALCRPGREQGYPIDIEVALPPHAGKATSIRGGYLAPMLPLQLRLHQDLSPNYGGSNLPLTGLDLARCKGPVLVGLGDGDDADRVKHGRIWAGGRLPPPNPLLLLLNPEYQQGRIACLAATADQRGLPRGRRDGGRRGAVATTTWPSNARPAAYKLNMPRFPSRCAAGPAGGSPDRARRQGRRRPALPRAAGRSDLLDPARRSRRRCGWSAWPVQRPALKLGLESPHPLVRFCSAESLAYLDCPAGGEERGPRPWSSSRCCGPLP